MVILLGLLAIAGILLAKLMHHNYRSLRRDIHAITSVSGKYDRPRERASVFGILDPYDHPGQYRKAQLHLHTANSIDVREKRPIADTLSDYRRAGYAFVVVTDHDRVTDCTELGWPDLIVIPGVEETVRFLMWPFGKHLLRIGLNAEAPLLAPAHLSWRGNLGTGTWHLSELLKRQDYQLVEIYNEKSDLMIDVWLWHILAVKRGFRNPVWAIAVDDSDNGRPLDRGWIMIKTPDLSRESFLNALKQGSFYATTGPLADFGVRGQAICVVCAENTSIRFIDARNEVVAVSRGGVAKYEPAGEEGFIRVEVTNIDGHMAWSQPFFLLPD